MELERLKIDRGERRRPARRRPWLAPTVIGLAALLIAVLFGPVVWRALDRWRLPEVRVAEVTEASVAAVGALRGAAANGHVVAARRAALSTDLSGRLVEINVTEGSVVAAGDVVARLYDADFRAALARSASNLEVALAGLDRARAARRAAETGVGSARRGREAAAARVDEARAAEVLARADLGRSRRLVREGVSPRRDLDAAVADLDAAAARRVAAEAEFRAARSAEADAAARVDVAAADESLAEAQRDAAAATRDEAAAVLAKTELRAPFDGVVVLKNAEVGEVVSPASQAGSNARGSVATLVDFASLEVQADVPETSLDAVRLGAGVAIFLDAFPERRYDGRVERIWPTADRQKATIEVRASFAEPDDRLRPDMGVRVVFLPPDEPASAPDTAEADGGVLVPESAVVRVDGQTAVLVLERDRVRLQAVTLGPSRAGRVSVRSGLTAGQRVVLEPPVGLDDGDRVRVAGG